MTASLPPVPPACTDDALAPATAASSAPVGQGLEALGPDELLPLLKIRQELTPRAQQVPLGSWFLTSDPVGHATCREVVLLGVTKERSFELPDADDARPAVVARIRRTTGVEVPEAWDGPVCASHDAARPEAQGGLPALAEACAACPMARWRTDASGRRLQDCAPRFRVALFDRFADHACRYLARGLAYGPTQDWLAALDVACRRHGLPAFAFGTLVYTRGVRRGDREVHVPVFGVPYPIDDAALVVRLLAERHRLFSGEAP